MNKTCMIYHSRDLDGLMSAAIVKKWFIENNKYCIIFDKGIGNEVKIPSDIIYDNRTSGAKEQSNQLYFLGWDYGDVIPDLSEYDKVIMCDISFPKETMLKLFNQLDTKLIWIDHHISAINELCGVENVYKDGHEDSTLLNGLRNFKFAACELTWKYFFPNERMPEIVRLLGRYDCFGHKFTKEDQDKLDALLDCEYNDIGNIQVLPYQGELDALRKKKDEEQKVLEFQYGARQVISNYEEAYKELNIAISEQNKTRDEVLTTYRYEDIHILGISIYDYLKTNAKQIYEKAFPIELIEKQYFNDKYTGEKIYRKFLCANIGGFNPNSFNLPYTKDGYNGFASFVYSNSKKAWTFTLMSETIDVSKIAKQYGGGGHFGAAGFIIEDLKQIIK